MTHAAAALQASQAGEAGITRIPVGLQLYAAAPAKEEAVFDCSAVYEGESPSTRAAITRFSMTVGASQHVRLAGFQAKAITALAPATGVGNAEGSSAELPSHVPAGDRSAPAAAWDAAAVAETVQQLINTMLNADVAPDQPLMEAGLDSLAAVELRTALTTSFAVDLPATVTFDFPTADALARFIASEVAEAAEAAALTIAPAPQPQESAGPPAAAAAAAAGPSAAQVEAKVATEVRRMLGTSVERSQPLMEAGMDSLGAVELRTALNTAFSLDLPATATFDFPSIAALSTFVQAELQEQAQEAAEAAHEAEAVAAAAAAAAAAEAAAIPALPVQLPAPRSHQPLVTSIVGVAAHYPRAASAEPAQGLAQFWSGMAQSADLPRRIPLQVRCQALALPMVLLFVLVEQLWPRLAVN